MQIVEKLKKLGVKGVPRDEYYRCLRELKGRTKGDDQMKN
jgi:hypothetical protein